LVKSGAGTVGEDVEVPRAHEDASGPEVRVAASDSHPLQVAPFHDRCQSPLVLPAGEDIDPIRPHETALDLT